MNDFPRESLRLAADRLELIHSPILRSRGGGGGKKGGTGRLGTAPGRERNQADG